MDLVVGMPITSDFTITTGAVVIIIVVRVRPVVIAVATMIVQDDRLQQRIGYGRVRAGSRYPQVVELGRGPVLVSFVVSVHDALSVWMNPKQAQ